MIKNIIFDLGGVIIDLHPEKTITEFSRICGISLQELQNILLNNRQIFIDYETGRINSQEFRKGVLTILNHDIPEHDFACAWNSIIFDVPEERIRMLEQLKKKYRLFLFSNINELHAQRVEEVLAASTVASGLLGYFEKVYYSHLVNKRKPDEEAFWLVLRENNLVPEETLFIDDMAENTKAAKKTGIQVLNVVRNHPELDFLLEN